MRLGSNAWLVVSSLSVASGCGAGALSATSGGSESDTGDSTVDPATGDGDGDGDGDPATGDGDGDTGSCIVDGELGRGLAFADTETEQVRVYAPDAEVQVFDVPPAEPGLSHDVAIAARGSSLVAVTNHWQQPSPITNPGGILRIFDLDRGEQSEETVLDGYTLSRVWMGPNGRVSARVSLQGESGVEGIVFVEGELAPLFDFRPIAPIRADGWVPGRIIADSGQTTDIGFLDVETLQFEALGIDLGGGNYHLDDEGRVEWIDESGEVPVLRRAAPDGQDIIELPAFASSPYPVFIQAEAGDYRILVSAANDEGDLRIARLALASGELLLIDPPLPPGTEPFECYTSNLGVDPSGRLTHVLRDPASAQVQAYDLQRDSWTPLGLPVSAIDSLRVSSTWGELFLIESEASQTTFCPWTMWEPAPPEALLGASQQLARIEPPLVLDLSEATAVTVDEDQTCAAWHQGETQVIYDLDDDEELVLPEAGVLIWLD